MSIRPVATRWFEVLVLKRDLTAVLECLARTGAVQLDAHAARTGRKLDYADMETEYDQLSARFAAWWPEPEAIHVVDLEDPAGRFANALELIRNWVEQAEGTVTHLQEMLAERERLVALQLLLDKGDDAIKLGDFINAGPLLQGRIYRVDPAMEVPDIPAGLVTLRTGDDSANYLYILGKPAAVAELDALLRTEKQTEIKIPDCVGEAPDKVEARLRERLGELETGIGQERKRLEMISARHGLSSALGEIVRLKWLNALVADVGETPRLSRITGWTSDRDGQSLQAALLDSGLPHLFSFGEAPEGSNPPVILSNPFWSRPFEMLTRLLGMPAAGDADPSMLVSLIAPVLFGFMFGDVGQGAVLLIAGLWLRGRVEALGVLVPGGLMAIVFGFLFGSVFSREDLIAPLWMHPLNDPVTLLVVSVVAGGAILLTGLFLDAVQAYWHGRMMHWLAGPAGLLIAYAGLLIAAVRPVPGLVMLIAGVLWNLLGGALDGGWKTIPAIAGKTVESLLQLAVNTVSFARTGAFALAHAGLSVAVIGLADAAGPVFYWLVLVLGNLFILALEGLVVSIQTTRLMLFEFFIRFLHAGGREFRPLRPPHKSVNSLTGGTP